VKSALSRVDGGEREDAKEKRVGGGETERDNTSTYQHNLSNCARSHGLMVSGIAVGVIRQQLVVVPESHCPVTCTNARAPVLSARITLPRIANHRY